MLVNAHPAPDTIRLRPVTADDARVLFDWATDPQVRAVSFADGELSWPRHQQWLQSKLAAADRAWLWMAETAEGMPLGQIRFECEGAQAVLSVSIGREFRGQGYGSQLIAAGCRWMFEHGTAQRIVAYVKPANLASQTALARSGFVLVETATRSGQPAQVWHQTRRDAP